MRLTVIGRQTRRSFYGGQSRMLFSTQTQSDEVLRPDVCIVGGGPAGAALACTLQTSGLFERGQDGQAKILLLDSSKEPEMASYSESNIDRTPEPRVVTLTPSSLRLLKSVGALNRCDHRFITPFYDMLVYEQAGNSYFKINNRQNRAGSPLVKLQEMIMNNFILNDD